jgi:glucose-6-phosphate 1-dehydrogenase
MPGRQSSFQVGLFAEPRKAPPCVFVLFGATGDLSARKIAPALYNLHRDGFLDDRMAVVGVARRPKSHEEFRGDMLAALKQHSRSQPLDEALWRGLAQRWHYQVVRADEPQDYAALAALLRTLAGRLGGGCGLVHYLANTPDVWPQTVAGLGGCGLSRPLQEGGFARIVVEKPFGHDLASARDLTARLREHWKESQIFRIDHYLGKETVQNILVLRLANSVFEPLLDRRHVDHVQITAAETAGMEGRRGAFYEQIGSLRDMIQNHLLQVLAMLTMDAPSSLATEAVRDQKARLLQSVKPLTPEEVRRFTLRGQYLGDGQTPGYRQEAGVAADSRMETYAAVRVEIDNDRWLGVPFYLRTGKRLAERTGYVVVQFKEASRHLFRDAQCDMGGPNRLVIQLQPREGAFLSVDAKVPGDRMLLRPVRLAFDYGSAFGSASPEAYERLLLDAMAGEASLFIRDDEVEACWRFVDAIRTVWDQGGGPELLTYPRGSWGPVQAEGVFADHYQRWYNLELR